MFKFMKIALIACRGQLPKIVHTHLKMQNHDVSIIGFYEVKSELQADLTVSLGQIGKILNYLRENDIQNVVLAGSLNRPHLWRLRFDYAGLKLAFKLMTFFKKGDDSLLRYICDYLANQTLKLYSIADLCPELLMPKGVMNCQKIPHHIYDSIEYGKNVLNALSPFDIGQSIAVAAQVVIAIEAIDGTDAMIRHVGHINKNRLNGLPKPIFIKMRKKNQSNLVDLPTVGVDTINNLCESGFGVAAFEAGGCLVVDIEAVSKRAKELGICVVGFNNTYNT
jgi:UDP-2,3-diacylglucosamine hydrolase